ncbi:hypothetical protein RIF29_14580 [Crotalaria pallida]|uniref:PWWP domain-containing protein n=1 Tax=Crotalaria pallida TaxID=3830 RepID=A0AAN9FHB2_CROPI
MGAVETQSGCSSPSPENDKNELGEALCALKGGGGGGGGGGAKENGVGGGEGVEQVVKSSRVFETRREVEDGCEGLADSEMNGVSSLLKMRGSGGGRSSTFSYGGDDDSAGMLSSGDGGGSFGVGMEGERKDLKKKSGDEDDQYGKIVTVDVPIVETSENKDSEMEDLGGEDYVFSAGDFVWGKIKSHPWWPGRIYDHSDASEFALKLRQKDRLLVAYFGDGTFAWCHPSQLKPFEENFEDMVMQSSSKAFANAVQEAVNEVGRLLDLKVTYSYSAKKTGSEFALPMAKNSGIKEGHLVPENGMEKLSNVLNDPGLLLSRVKQFAQVIAVTSILELEVLKARLSAIYLSRGGYKLPYYEEPQPIPGLEDSSMDETVDVGNSKGAVEVPVHGPFEEEYTLPVSPKSDESNPQGISGNKSNHWRKQKSIAEIMGGDKDGSTTNKEADITEEVMVKKKRKGSENATPSKPVQKGKGFASAKNDGSGGKENSDNSTLSQLKEKKKASNASRKVTDEGNPEDRNVKGSLSRDRKKSKYLSPPFTTPPTRGQRKGDIETESLKVSSKARQSEPITSASDQEDCSNKLSIELDLPDSSNYQTQDDAENNIIDPKKIQTPSREFLSEVRYASINPQTPRDINSLEKLVGFISVYKSSLYRHGSYYKVYKKHQPGRKKKKPESDVEIMRKDQNQTDHISPNNDSEPKKRRKKKEPTSGILEEQSAKSKTGKKRSNENGSEAAAAALLVSFGPGSSLPSKHDLVTVYSQFGALNESETRLTGNYTAQVSFLKASDAEKALNHSRNTSPFGSSEVSFNLQYISAAARSGEHGKKSKSKASSSAKSHASLLPGSEASRLNYIKHKIVGMTSLLEASDGKSPDLKTKLESEMKQLLEDVNKMVESSSS